MEKLERRVAGAHVQYRACAPRCSAPLVLQGATGETSTLITCDGKGDLSSSLYTVEIRWLQLEAWCPDMVVVGHITNPHWGKLKDLILGSAVLDMVQDIQ